MLTELFANFQFTRPYWLAAVPLVFLLARYLVQQSAGAGWRKYMDPGFLEHLTTGENGSQKIFYTTAATGLMIACIALAGPAWQSVAGSQGYNRQGTVVLLDLSPSMLAQDIAPSRLVRARLKLIDFLRRQVDGETALVVYAGDAHRVAPLTHDPSIIESLVHTLEPAIMPVAGSRPEEAVSLANTLFESAGLDTGDILLITDGVVDEALTTIRQQLDKSRLSVLAVGTAAGAPIPDVDGGYLSDQQGNPLIAAVNIDDLRALAADSGGRFARLGNDDTDIGRLMSLPPRAVNISESDDGQVFDEQHDAGYWLMLLVLPFALLAFRRQVFWVMIPLVLVAPDGYAFGWQDLWLNKNQQAAQALNSGSAGKAANLFTHKKWQAVAHYTAGDFSRAAELFREATDANAFYNLGNALALDGDTAGAIEAYRLALAVDVKHTNAAHNLSLLRSLTEPREEQTHQQNRQQKSIDEGQSIETVSADEQSRNQSSEVRQQQIGGSIAVPQQHSSTLDQSSLSDGGQSAEAVTGVDPGDPEVDSNSGDMAVTTGQAPEELLSANGNHKSVEPVAVAEENQNTVLNPYSEQWLRNLPQDPGGYLRRKFQYQAQVRRESEGEPVNNDSERY